VVECEMDFMLFLSLRGRAAEKAWRNANRGHVMRERAVAALRSTEKRACRGGADRRTVSSVHSLARAACSVSGRAELYAPVRLELRALGPEENLFFCTHG